MSFKAKWIAAVIIAIVLFAIGTIQSVGTDALGISPLVARWLSVITAVLGFIAATFLPRAIAGPDQPLASDIGYPPASASDIHLLHAAAAVVDVVLPLVPTSINAPPGAAA